MSETLRILVASHISIIRNGLRSMIDAEDDFVLVGEAESGYRVQKLCQQLQPQVTIIDASLPGPSISCLVENLLVNRAKNNILILADSVDNVDVLCLMERGISGCMLQQESDILMVQAIRTVGLGGVWFSKPFVSQVIQPQSESRLPLDRQCGLTSRELGVAELVATGMSNKEIAGTLKITERTIEFHMANIFQKLNVNNRVAVALWVKGNR